MKALVTGCAGFIGSHLTERLLADGYEVTGIDCFRDYYAREIKERNLAPALSHDNFTFIEEDLTTMENYPEVDYVFHQAAQAGVRASWGESFGIYTRDNITATQKLLEFYKDHPLKRFVYASSSSVYGDNVSLPMKETARPQPLSPYGVTKLAAEHLCHLYWANYQVPTVALRYFTVYGPRQRPDMGINKFVHVILAGEPVTIYGDGTQTQDFTYVDDIVEANVCAALAAETICGEAFNVGGGNRITVNDLISEIGHAIDKEPIIHYAKPEKGDVKDTWADTEKAHVLLNWNPNTTLKSGIVKYINWTIKDAI